MTTTTLVLILALFLALNGGLLWFFLGRKEEEPEPVDDKSFLLIQDQIHKLTETVSSKLKDVTSQVTEVRETNKQVFSFTESLQNLERVLTNQKRRGELGEAGLKLTLENVLPPSSYEYQYMFSNGEAVDAIIKTKDGIIPIDAKFSLDNYNRIVAEEDPTRREALEKEFKNDLKKRIDETAKYIRPEEGTHQFALMYIPAEGIYYDLLVNKVGAIKVNTRSLIDYAYREKKVIIVSPTTLVAYLHTILQGFRAFQIEQSAQVIAKQVDELRRHLHAYGEYHTKLGKTIGTVVNHFNSSGKEFNKIDKDVHKITGKSIEVEQVQLDRPDSE